MIEISNQFCHFRGVLLILLATCEFGEATFIIYRIVFHQDNPQRNTHRVSRAGQEVRKG